MKILAVDSSANVASAAITEDDKLICEFTLNHKKTHSEKLMPMIDELFHSAQLTPGDIDLFAAANGPGSFTGLRIGVATVKGLAHAVQKPVAGVSTLLAMAYNLPFCGALVAPIMDARRAQVYNGIYRWRSGRFEAVAAPRAIAMRDCLADLRELGEPVVFLGDGVPVHREQIQAQLGGQAMFAPSSCNRQRAASVALAAAQMYQDGLCQNYYTLAPVYLRKPQAEREWEEKENVSNRQ